MAENSEQSVIDYLTSYMSENNSVYGNYKVEEIPTENGVGYLVTYGPSQSPNSGAIIISDKATVDQINAAVELKPGTGEWVGGIAQPTLGRVTYGRLFKNIRSGDFSNIPSNAIVSVPITYQSQHDSLPAACGFVEYIGNDVEHIGDMGFSGSGGESLISETQLILSQKYPNATYRVINCDAYCQEDYIQRLPKYSEEQLKLITDKLEVVNFFSDEEGGKRNIGGA